MAKNLEIDTKEFKLSGILNTDNINEGIITLEAEDGGVIQFHEKLSVLNGNVVEINIKNKIEKLVTE